MFVWSARTDKESAIEVTLLLYNHASRLTWSHFFMSLVPDLWITAGRQEHDTLKCK